LVGRYGQTTDAGLTRKGISIETRIDAQVVTPYDGLVVFAGQFRGYGQILILEHGEGYHTLLAGLTRIDAVPGQWLAAGEPVGVMESADRGTPVLYMELRRNGQPINPLPWLASQKDKVSG
jgi:septal ring factor EnvC (AmiA/AmiB activator)